MKAKVGVEYYQFAIGVVTVTDIVTRIPNGETLIVHQRYPQDEKYACNIEHFEGKVDGVNRFELI